MSEEYERIEEKRKREYLAKTKLSEWVEEKQAPTYEAVFPDYPRVREMGPLQVLDSEVEAVCRRAR